MRDANPGQHIVQICKQAAAISLKSVVPVLYGKPSNLKYRNVSRVNFEKLQSVGGPWVGSICLWVSGIRVIMPTK
jgi:hypothetical protein